MVGVKRRVNRRGSTLHGTVVSAAVIILLLVGGVGEELAVRGRRNVNGTVRRRAVIILLFVGGVGLRDGMIGGEYCAWNRKQCSSDHITVSLCGRVDKTGR